MKLMIWSASPGGMRTVVESYVRDGFIREEDVRLIASYRAGGFFYRQMVFISAVFEFAWCVCVYKVNLVHCHAAMRGSFWRKSVFVALGHMLGIPTVLHLHGSEMQPFYDSQPAFVRRIIRITLEKADLVLVLSAGWKSFVGSIAPKARIEVLPNYVSIPEQSLRPEPDDAFVKFLFLGLIGDRKGSFDLIRAFSVVASDCPRVRLTMAGNGQVDRARELALSLGMENHILFPGWIDGRAKEILLRQADVFVLPSYNEGLPVSLLEALASGLTVVSSRAGAIPEVIVDGVSGLLVDSGNVEALANALERCASDADLRKSLARAGLDRVRKEYSTEVILPRLRTLYAAIAGLRVR